MAEIRKSKIIKVLEMIAMDTENDAKSFDGKPFDGKTVAEYFGNHGASIKALAEILKEVLESESFSNLHDRH